MLKRIHILFLLSVLPCPVLQAQEYFYTEASSLTLVGRLFQDNTNPYHRVDTLRYKGFSESENAQVRCPAGIAVLFRTDSPSIVIREEFGYMYPQRSTMALSYRGYDLYIKKDGRWLYAASAASRDGKTSSIVKLIKGMDGGSRECLLYLPIYSELLSCSIGVEKGCRIERMESPFRHRIVAYGSSFTQGISTSRSGMAYPSQLMRRTGLEVVSLGCGGNCKMQPYFADVLTDVDADAFLFDTFSNCSAQLIEERLEPFILRMQAAHPGKPLIFQQTIYREGRNFDTEKENFESSKIAMAEKLMKEYCRKYKDVYFIHPDATGPDNEYSVDGTHPDDYGYRLWEKSIEKPLLRILRKYKLF